MIIQANVLWDIQEEIIKRVSVDTIHMCTCKCSSSSLLRNNEDTCLSHH